MPHRHFARHAHRHVHHHLTPRPPATTSLESPSIVRRADSASNSRCTPGDNSPQCEKPASSMSTTLPVVLGVLIPVVCAAVVLFILHRRHVKRLKYEDANDKHKSLDFGMEVVPSGGNDPEKEGHHKRGGLSLDIGNSPYLLPPELQDSKESLREISRAMTAEDDKYRPATSLSKYNDTASVHSHSRWVRDDASSFAHSPRTGPDDPHDGLIRNASRMSRSSPPPPRLTPSPSPHPREEPISNMEQAHVKQPLNDFDLDLPPSSPAPNPARSSANPSERNSSLKESSLPAVLEPGRHAASSDNRLTGNFSLDPAENDHFAPGHGGHTKDDDRATAKQTSHETPRQSTLDEYESGAHDRQSSYTFDQTIPTIREPPIDAHSTSSQAPRISFPSSDGGSDYGDGPSTSSPVKVSSAADEAEKAAEKAQSDQAGTDNPSESSNRLSTARPMSKRVSVANRLSKYRLTQHFGALDDSFDPKRLTVGLRPLPPEDPSDNPEQRANRIRSFYKEYFDDNKNGPDDYYYEDFGPEFYGDPHVYDVAGEYLPMPPKPFAQGPGRRAMTPPPRPPPRNMGSNSAMGHRDPGPRAFSSASNRLPAMPKKPPVAPPPLHELPSPHLIKDDMSIMPTDYAPGKTIKDQREGRPDTPRGGLRPYTPTAPAHSPLVSAFDELSAIPSPHALRKSGAYSALDFAPPQRFKNPDAGAGDAGSVRSHGSGISPVHLHNIRKGAYRVSRLPADTVGTMDDLQSSLRPKWDMRGS